MTDMATTTATGVAEARFLPDSPETENSYYHFEEVTDSQWRVTAADRHVGYQIREAEVNDFSVWHFVGPGETAHQRRHWHTAATRDDLEAWMNHWFPQIIAEATWPGSTIRPDRNEHRAPESTRAAPMLMSCQTDQRQTNSGSTAGEDTASGEGADDE
ncbi:hypothetical protein [Subtercola sp. YIM 133946]|uniref:hypothetical protein n=1 Tax=Subtercola sp. YIM 133946 TaxID=3118909 RepID=UPI002F95747B